jgi:hypothetical protein
MRNPLSLEALADWSETRDPDEQYQYSSPRECLCAQYLRFAGFRVCGVLLDQWLDSENIYHRLPDGFNAVAIGNGLAGSWTYGQAAERARALART